MQKFKFIIAALSISFLAGCSHTLQKPSQSVGNLADNANSTYAKTANAATVKTKTIKEYVPVAIPGQLMPTPKVTGNTTKSLKKEDAVKQANKSSIIEPNSDGYFNAIMTYNYMPGALYLIYTAPMRITDIALQKGEKIISEAAGDTLRWQVSQTYSGTGANLEQHILIKPNRSNLDNTMIITTDRRVYHLILKSTNNNTYMVAVKWHYPDNMVTTFNQQPTPTTTAATNSGLPLSLNKLNFNYKFGMLRGDKPAWYPTRIFSDNRQTFIEFPHNFVADSLPVLYIANNNGKYGTMVNWRLKGRYMVIDTLIKKARLQTGIKKTGRTIVQIEANN